MKDRANPTWVKLLTSIFALLSGSALITANVNVEIHETPEAARMGWEPTERPDDAERFRIVGAEPGYTSEGTVVKLWDYSKAINSGKHFPTYRQEVGDCVANGAANAVNYLQAVQIARGPEQLWDRITELNGPNPPDFEPFTVAGPAEFKPAHRPFIYGVSRTHPKLGNKRLRGDGSTGYWAAYGCRDVGVVAATDEDVPKYSGTLARQWGRSGPPGELMERAGEFRVRNVALVESYEDVRDALANGYPVTIASNAGFQMRAVESDGKHWGKRSGSWSHQMCLIAVDDTAKSPFNREVGACYCLNSWGESAHGPPVDDAPPGGFWIDRRTVEYIVKQGDSWAFSNFDGFPTRDLDFQVFGAASPVDLVEFEAQSVTMPIAATVGMDPTDVNNAGCFGLTLTGFGVLAGYGAARRKRRFNLNRSVA